LPDPLPQQFPAPQQFPGPQQFPTPQPLPGVNPGFDAIPVQPKQEVSVAQGQGVSTSPNDAEKSPVPTLTAAANSPVADPRPVQPEPVSIAQNRPLEADPIFSSPAPKPLPAEPVTSAQVAPPAENPTAVPLATAPLPVQPEPIKIAQASPPPAPKAETFDLGSIVESIKIPEAEKERTVEPVDLSKLPATKPPPVPPVSKPAEKKVASAPPAKVNDSVSIKPRYWVQISTGETAVMQGEYRRLSRKYVDLFKGQQGWTSPWKTISRLLVGPFDGYDSANEWYNSLKKAGGDGFVWNSAQGTEVTKLSGK
jgi:hypothetical protein